MLKNLKELRSETQFTQKQLAEMLNISQQTYSNYENCITEPTTDSLIALCEIFNTSADYLLGLVDDFGVKITPEERAEGASEVKRIYVTPKEDELIYLFREVGKRHGAKAQSAILEMADNLLKL